MLRFIRPPSLFLLALAMAASAARAQAPSDPCARPDSIAVRGNSRVNEAQIRSDAQISAGSELNFREVQRALKGLFGTGQFADVRLLCDPDPATSRATLVLEVEERPLVADVQVSGADNINTKTVRERIEIPSGRPLDPATVTSAVARIDSLYEARGYYLADIRADSSLLPDGKVRLTFRVDEGRRLAISGIDIRGNSRIREKEIVKAMKTRPEGFFWFRKGEFDPDRYASDLGDRIPSLFASRGLVDFQIVKDTLIVDRDRGKALVRIDVEEGPRYRVGTFDIVGNRRFSTEEIRRFYPFGERDPGLREQITSVLRRNSPDPTLFNQSEWDEATNRIRSAYSNEGYIYAQVRPVVERVAGADSVPTVNLRWEIEEKTPATINRVEIVGNDYTTEACIRDALVLLPGDVFNQERLVRSYQQIANMGFFETPLPPPDTRPANDKGDVDIVFRVKEKRTGNVNLGASVGQGTGLGGFLGLDQPNLFGRCKRVSLNWSFGQYLNQFQLSYTDPAIRKSRISGTVTAYHTQARYVIQDLGRTRSTGGSVQFGFPAPWSPFTRLFVSYGAERLKYSGGIFERDTTAEVCDNCFRSTVGFGAQHDTRIDLPFATAGSLQRFDANLSGGPLGGTAAFQKYTTEIRGYAPLWQIGGSKPGSQPIKFVAGLTGRAGAIFGSTGALFVSQQFSLGGTQYGEILRGYDEFSITPNGFNPNTTNQRAQRSSFGNAFMTTTAEFGVRFNQMLYTNVFFDAGNIWSRAREIDPTRLFRGAGVGVALVTPLGPLGLDWAYGFDRTDVFGRPDPKWQLHFRLGNIF